MATKSKIEVGDMAEFLGYDDIDDEMEEFYKPGEVIKIREYKGEGTYVAVNAAGVLDSVYEEEFKVNNDLEFPKKSSAKKKAAPKKEVVEEKEEKPKAEKKTVKKPVAKKTTSKKAEKKPAKAAAKKSVKKAAEVKAPKEKPAAELIEVKDVEVMADDGGGEQLSLLPAVAAIDMSAVDEQLKSNENRKEVAESIFSAVRTLANTVAHSYYQLGALLVYIRNNNLHKELGYPDTVKGFVQYCNEEGKTTDYITYDRAKNWIYIYDRAQALNIDEQRLAKIGWTKAIKLLRSSETEEDFAELAEVAEEGSREDLIEAINAKTSDKPKETKQSKLFKFKLASYKADTVEAVMNHYADTYTDGDLTDFLYLLCVEFRDRHSSVDVNIDEHVDLFEKRFNVKIKGYESLGPIPSYGDSLKKSAPEVTANKEDADSSSEAQEPANDKPAGSAKKSDAAKSRKAPRRAKKAESEKKESKPVKSTTEIEDITLDDLFSE